MHIGVYRTQRAEDLSRNANMRNIRRHLVNSLFDLKLANPDDKGYLEVSHRDKFPVEQDSTILKKGLERLLDNKTAKTRETPCVKRQ